MFLSNIKELKAHKDCKTVNRQAREGAPCWFLSNQQGAEKRQFHGSIDGLDSVTDSSLCPNTSPQKIQIIDSS